MDLRGVYGEYGIFCWGTDEKQRKTLSIEKLNKLEGDVRDAVRRGGDWVEIPIFKNPTKVFIGPASMPWIRLLEVES